MIGRGPRSTGHETHNLSLNGMNTSRFVKTFIVKLLLILSGIEICALVAKLIYIQQVTRHKNLPLDSSLLTCSLGVIAIDSIMLVVLGIAFWKLYQKSLRRPLTELSRVIQDVHAQTTSLLNAPHDTEIQALAKATEKMLKRITSLRDEVNAASQKILEVSQTLLNASQNQTEILALQMHPADEMITTVRELVMTTQHIGEDVNAVVDVANNTLQIAEQGQSAVTNVITSMEDIRRSSQVSSDKIIALGKQSEHISEVVKTIDRIIEDTKLIAFNATIEAARAKEEGRGFGVVALEIKRLAEEVFESTEDIKELIQEILSISHALVLATEEEMKTILRGADLAEDAGTSLARILDMVTLTTASAQRIASATQQQQGASEHVLHAVEAANQVNNQFSQDAQRLTVIALELNLLADKLQQIISAVGVSEK